MFESISFWVIGFRFVRSIKKQISAPIELSISLEKRIFDLLSEIWRLMCSYYVRVHVLSSFVLIWHSTSDNGHTYVHRVIKRSECKPIRSDSAIEIRNHLDNTSNRIVPRTVYKYHVNNLHKFNSASPLATNPIYSCVSISSVPKINRFVIPFANQTAEIESV